MDEFQFKIMEDILMDPHQKLTIEQCETYSKYLMPKIGRTAVNVKDYILQPPKLLQKKLFNKIARSSLNRGAETSQFMSRMLSKVW